jgi:3-oxosteroid 1-dehydrogenase
MAAYTTDVLVLGSGLAGLVAALTAARRGFSVTVLEKTDRPGGTTAMSGAGTWIAANHLAAEAGIEDRAEEALAYIRAAAPPGWAETEDALWQAFAHAAPEMLRFVEANTPLRFALTGEPDPLRALPGSPAARADDVTLAAQSLASRGALASASANPPSPRSSPLPCCPGR